jgi:hypothetical protein
MDRLAWWKQSQKQNKQVQGLHICSDGGLVECEAGAPPQRVFQSFLAETCGRTFLEHPPVGSHLRVRRERIAATAHNE